MTEIRRPADLQKLCYPPFGGFVRSLQSAKWHRTVSFVLGTKTLFDSLTLGSSESGIRLSNVDMPMCRIATTCWRVRSASSGISGQILDVFVVLINLCPFFGAGRSFLRTIDLNIQTATSFVKQHFPSVVIC